MALTREVLDGIERCLHAHAGFDLPEWVVETRASARMKALDLDERSYLELVTGPRGAPELAALVEAVRVGETRFFRHRPHVDALLEVVVPAWRKRGERSPRVWSAGCATGEEPYTLALVLDRSLPRPAFTPSILATDVSAEAIAAARRATYPAEALAEVPELWQKGLIREGGRVRVAPEIAALVTFEQQNLADEDLPRGFDLVWCRNVLIYFGPEARARVLERLVHALNPGGYLFVGYSETLRHAVGLEAVRWGDQILWQKTAVTAGGHGRARAHPTKITPASRQPATREHRRSPAPSNSGAPSPARAPAAGRAPSQRRIAAADPAALAGEIRAALSAPGVGTVTIDLDAAEYLDDAVAPVLRRAGAAASAAGIELVLRATRPGPLRWLRRNGLAGGGA